MNLDLKLVYIEDGVGCWGIVGGMRSQQEQIDAVHDWQDSAERKLKHIKDIMDELGHEVNLHWGWSGMLGE